MAGNARRFVPHVPGMPRVDRAMGAMRSGQSFIDWTDVYVDTREPERQRRRRSYIDYILCAACDQQIAIHKGPGVTHRAGKPYHKKCADKE